MPGEDDAVGPSDVLVANVRSAVLASLSRIGDEWRAADTRGCILLSGGLDTSIVAESAREAGLALSTGFTTLCSEHATDRPWAPRVAAAAGIAHIVVERTLDELLAQNLDWTVGALKTFDPMALRNSIATAAALRTAAAAGFTRAVTGDGADELFGGYSFTHGLTEDRFLLNRAYMAQTMRFSAVDMGRALGIHVSSPFTSPGVVALALLTCKADCVAPVVGGSPAIGKLVLRRAFPEVVASARSKDPIEVGCGSTALGRGHFSLAEPAADPPLRPVILRDAEHAAYHAAFLRCFPGGHVPGLPWRNDSDSTDPCPACGYELSDRAQTFCVTCGHYDAGMRTRHDAGAGSGEPAG